MGFGGPHPSERNLQLDLTEGARTVSLNIAFGRVVSLIFTNRVTVASGETNDAHLDRFLVHWIHSHRRAAEHDATIQHPPRKFNLVLAIATSQYHAQVERTQKSLPPFGWDTEPVIGTEVVVRRWGDVHGCIL